MAIKIIAATQRRNARELNSHQDRSARLRVQESLTSAIGKESFLQCRRTRSFVDGQYIRLRVSTPTPSTTEAWNLQLNMQAYLVQCMSSASAFLELRSLCVPSRFLLAAGRSQRDRLLSRDIAESQKLDGSFLSGR